MQRSGTNPELGDVLLFIFISVIFILKYTASSFGYDSSSFTDFPQPSLLPRRAKCSTPLPNSWRFHQIKGKQKAKLHPQNSQMGLCPYIKEQPEPPSPLRLAVVLVSTTFPHGHLEVTTEDPWKPLHSHPSFLPPFRRRSNPPLNTLGVSSPLHFPILCCQALYRYPHTLTLYTCCNRLKRMARGLSDRSTAAFCAWVLYNC